MHANSINHEAGQRPRLELTWLGKESRPRLEPRVLLEDEERSYYARHRVRTNDHYDNKIIVGDNLLALKALEQEYAGKVKCIFIDPPYNTGSAFEQYDDGLEHSLWLTMMRDRLLVLRRLLRQDGSLWITIDDNEAHYLKVVCDEVFGRRRRSWTKRASRAPRSGWRVWCSTRSHWRPGRRPSFRHRCWRSSWGSQPGLRRSCRLCQSRAVFERPEEQRVAQLAHAVIQEMGRQPQEVRRLEDIMKVAMQASIVEAVEAEYAPAQGELEVTDRPDIKAIVAQVSERTVNRTIAIPRIVVVPRGDVTARFEPFQLDLSALRYPPVSEELWIRHLRTGDGYRLSLTPDGVEEKRLEDYVVSGLIDFDEISYDAQADYLYELAGQVVRHLLTYLSEEDARKVLRYHQREIARFVYAQMQPHFREEASGGYEAEVKRGFTELKPSAYTAAVSDGALDYRTPPPDKTSIARYLFTGFSGCLYDVQKFQSDAERRLAVIFERDDVKWMKPAKGQFQIWYTDATGQAEYLPDFVAETDDAILMVKVKARNELENPVVLAKRSAARAWCGHATAFTTEHGGKPWRYVMIPDDQIAENAGLAWLVERFSAPTGAGAA